MILHAIHAEADTIVVHCRDTDVLLLLLAHSARIQCDNLWMKAGTSQAKKYIPIMQVSNRFTTQTLGLLLPFHALTGSDTTSFISGHSKKTAYKIFTSHSHLLKGLGRGQLTKPKLANIEKFICLVYKMSDNITTTDSARCALFAVVSKPDNLPPTSDALKFHIMRSHFQIMIWNQAFVTE